MTRQLCVSGLQAAAPLPVVGPGQTVQLGPQAAALSAAHVPGWPQVFVPAAQTHPPAPSETNPFAASQVKPHAPAVHVAMPPAGTGHTVQLAPHRSGLSALQVVSAPQAFVFTGQTQPPAPLETNDGLHANPHAPAVQVGEACTGAVQALQAVPHRDGVSGLHAVSAPHTFAPSGHTQAPPVETNVASHWNPHPPFVQVAAECGGAEHGVQLAPQTAAVSATHVAGWPQLFEPSAQVQPPAPSGTNPLALSQAKLHLPAVQVGTAPTGVVLAQSTQFGPQEAVVSRAQLVAPPQTFVPLGQAQPPALSGTKPLAVSQVKLH